jgi:hypothetical protein
MSGKPRHDRRHRGKRLQIGDIDHQGTERRTGPRRRLARRWHLDRLDAAVEQLAS